MRQNEVNNLKMMKQINTVSTLPDKELRAILNDLTPLILNRWMQYFIRREEYEVCQVIKEILRDK